MNANTTTVNFATVDQDLGMLDLVPSLVGPTAQQLANEFGTTVYARHPVSDRVITSRKPR